MPYKNLSLLLCPLLHPSVKLTIYFCHMLGQGYFLDYLHSPFKQYSFPIHASFLTFAQYRKGSKEELNLKKIWTWT